MKYLSIVITVVFLNAYAFTATAQDLESNNSVEQNESPAVSQFISKAIKHIQRFSDLAKRELLQTTSVRNLQFRCGRYWVDVYGKLIAPDDREIGIWGVDFPAHGVIPIGPIRR